LVPNAEMAHEYIAIVKVSAQKGMLV